MSSSSSSSSSSTEPDWKVKQREQDALIGKEETAVKTRVVEMLKPILEGADKVTSQGDDAAQLQLQGELSEKIRQATKMLEEGLVERDRMEHDIRSRGRITLNIDRQFTEPVVT